VVRVIELSRSSLPAARAASKLNRDPLFIQSLICHGEQQARLVSGRACLRAGLGGQRCRRGDRGSFAEDSELVSAPPFT